MATLNMSLEGPSINKSYKTIVDALLPTGVAALSPTYGQWALYSVSAPLANAFTQDTNKESVLRVASTGEGELVDLIDEFSDGRIQFAFLKVKDPNTTLPKSVLIAWCGAGVPERTKGYFGSHLTTVSKVLHGYHVQVTARSENDLTPEGIIRKVSDASGSKYSGDRAPPSSNPDAPPAPVTSKPVFTPTAIGGGARGFNPLASNARTSAADSTDADGWGADAPQVTRTQLEKVAPAYRPTKVSINQLTSQEAEPSRFTPQSNTSNDRSDVIRGGYQPIGKVDIAAIRRQAQQSGSTTDDRPTAVKGSYEPVGKVDIAAIRARAQPSSDVPQATKPITEGSGATEQESRSLADRSAAFSQSERLTSLPKPKVANRFGAGASSFAGTKAPTPVGFGSAAAPAPAPVGMASKNFADEGGKTPAQIWAEKKARERGASNAAETTRPAESSTTPVVGQTSGGWDAGYSGKKWASVSTSKTSQASGEREIEDGSNEEPSISTGGVSAMRDRFKNAAPMDAGSQDQDEDDREPPPPPMANRPTPFGGRGGPTPGLPQRDEIPDEEPSRMLTPPPQPPRSPTPPTPPAMRSGSPIRIAQPVGRGNVLEAPEERLAPAPMPLQSMSNAVPHPDDMEDEPQAQDEDTARGAGQAAAETTFGAGAASADPGSSVAGKRALVQYDYEKAEDNELELREGEYVTNIDMVDEDWWMGTNPRGESGLFPSNYVELDEGEGEGEVEPEPAPLAPPAPPAAPAQVAAHTSSGPSAVAEYDYEAAEDNELSFPEGATITELEFPDDDWWHGEYNGRQGLFPSNYVTLNQ